LNLVLIGSALVMGVVGQVHCATMCSGVAAVACGGASHGAGRVTFVHIGRITAYALQGALFAALGAWIAQAAPVRDAQLVIRVLAGLVLVAAGLQLAGIANPLGRLERWTSGPMRRMSGWLGRSSRAGGAGDLARGFAWGLLPCGLVQGALALALASGDPQTGALVMVAFGVGTLPVLLIVGRLARGVLALSSHPKIRRAAGGLIILSGAVQITMAAMDVGVIQVRDEAKPCCAGKGHG
jgi:sulfite exporter TauE/SafE